MKLIQKINNECSYCDKKVEFLTIVDVGFIFSRYFFDFVCKDHAKKTSQGKFNIDLKGNIKYHEK